MIQGVVEYTIEDDKIVFGTFTNDVLIGHHLYEIVFKREKGLVGTYSAAFYDNKGEVVQATLEVSRNPDKQKVFDLSWTYAGARKPAFKGRGYLLSDNRMVVSYQSA
jgi:hypothetical protein